MTNNKTKKKEKATAFYIRSSIGCASTQLVFKAVKNAASRLIECEKTKKNKTEIYSPATVILNGRKKLCTKNFFLPHNHDYKQHLQIFWRPLLRRHTQF